jgi:chromosome segregation ATPase
MADELIPPTDPATEIAQLRERIAQLEADLRDARTRGDSHDSELTGLRAQLAKLTTPDTKRRRMDGFFEVEGE